MTSFSNVFWTSWLVIFDLRFSYSLIQCSILDLTKKILSKWYCWWYVWIVTINEMIILYLHLQNRVSTEDDESQLSSLNRVSRLSLSLSWVKRKNVCQSITIKWRKFDNNERFFMIFVKNINFSKNKFIVDCVFFFRKTRVSSTTISWMSSFIVSLMILDFFWH
jgi:hypothetical protein